jgi:murein DD-endopeptidase MepM/ murein hydrolase activator NlpD
VVLEKVEDEEEIIRIKFAEMILGGSKNKYCVGDGPVVEAKYPVFRFPVECGYVSQGYGNTIFAAIDNAYNGAIHNGFDVGVGTGSEIYAIGSGTVYANGESPSGGWGNWVMTKHEDVLIREDDEETEDVDEEIKMSFYALYAHLVSKTHLDVGDSVNENTVVGFVGGTPYWAPHLHFSLFLSDSGWKDGETGDYPGNTIDPLNYMDIPISTQGTDWDARYIHFST